jgi:hypothetical protein
MVEGMPLAFCANLTVIVIQANGVVRGTSMNKIVIQCTGNCIFVCTQKLYFYFAKYGCFALVWSGHCMQRVVAVTTAWNLAFWYS